MIMKSRKCFIIIAITFISINLVVQFNTFSHTLMKNELLDKDNNGDDFTFDYGSSGDGTDDGYDDRVDHVVRNVEDTERSSLSSLINDDVVVTNHSTASTYNNSFDSEKRNRENENPFWSDVKCRKQIENEMKIEENTKIAKKKAAEMAKQRAAEERVKAAALAKKKAEEKAKEGSQSRF